jgi:BlaI family transcriptional regulator, penicillinase repressor
MTSRSSQPRPPLSPLETECMALFWSGTSLTAEAVREALPKRLRESTVRTLLRRIMEKGYLTHTVDGRTYVYRAADAPSAVAASGIRRLARQLYRGSVADMLVGMVDNREIDAAELDALLTRIQAKRSPVSGDTTT